MIIEAPAKLNIRLKVVGRRPDGYHEVVSIMIPINLCDQIELHWTHDKHLTLSCQDSSVPEDETNLVLRAAKTFFSRTGLHPRLSISLTKKIPVAAGLGGGSSDAGRTLKALNDFFSNPLSPQELADLATHLGADVPFFLRGTPCLATGIGDVLEPVEKWPELWYVVVAPALQVSTAWAYGNLKLALTIGEYEYIVEALRKERLDFSQILENDLEAVTASHFPVIDIIKKSLLDAGAKGALMSGSGPTVFGIFNSQADALRAKRRMEVQNFGGVFVANQWKMPG